MSRTPGSSGLAEGLKKLGSYSGQIAHIEHLPASPARHRALSEPLPVPLASYLTTRGIQLWSHQVDTIEAVRLGQDTILATSTGSGKTLAFNLPVFERLATSPEATALYLYPMKALANDQLLVATEMERSTGIKVGAAVYDGDTPQGRRGRIRATSRLVITNPYGLHEYLPNHHLWERFFSRLSLVVVDEAHWYRGVFGSNVAMVLRRLRRVADNYGADPCFILASGTIANPAEHAHALVGRAHRVVAGDGAPHGPKAFVLWNPLANPARSPHLQAADLLAHFAATGHQAICFTVSRRMAELVARWAQEAAPARHIVAYRAGYQAAVRREIEGGLRRGEIDAVAATSALELGIDVGRLDAVVMAGYPGTICSTWQQAGRAGRTRADSIATLVAFEDPLDQYLVSHPEELFGKPHEHAVVDLANPQILGGHLMCAAAELPLRETDAEYFGPGMAETITALTAEGLLAETSMGHVFHGTFRPAGSVPLDAVDDHVVEVRYEEELLETLSLRRALATAHPGAILLHQGDSYRVETLDLENGVARTVAEPTDNYTEALHHISIQILGTQACRNVGRGQLSLGQVRTSEHFYAYHLKARERVLATEQLDLPSVMMDTAAIWLILPPVLTTEVRAADQDYAGGLHAAEHALIHMMPLLAMCDRGDVGGMSTPWHGGAAGAVIFVYDAYEGGIGIAEKAYEHFERLAEITLGLLEGCGCSNGCPSCVYDRNCGNENQPIDRMAAVAVVKSLSNGA